MTLYAKLRLDGDDARMLAFQAGWVSEMMDDFSPEQQERIRAEEAREQLQIEAEAFARAIDESPNMPGWAQPPVYSVSERLAAFSAAQDRQDRREAAQAALQHGPQCGCIEVCGNRDVSTEPERSPRRLSTVVDKELAAHAAAVMATPATVADVTHLANDLSKVKRLLGKRLLSKG